MYRGFGTYLSRAGGICDTEPCCNLSASVIHATFAVEDDEDASSGGLEASPSFSEVTKVSGKLIAASS